MTTMDHVRRARRAEPLVCHCRTCGLTTQLVRGKLVSKGWSREDAARVITVPPREDCSYPYLASLRVDGQEVYRVHADLAEATDPDVIRDVEAALNRRPQ